MNEQAFQWVVSGGGPLLVLDKSLVTNWKGYEGSVDAELTNVELTNSDDYERACKIDGYLGLIDVGVGKGVILGDAPLPTTWFPFPEKDGGLIVRKWYAIDELLTHSLAQLNNDTFQTDIDDFNVLSGELYVFDSACPGSDLDCTQSNCMLKINLVPAVYKISTQIHEPDQNTNLVIHRLSADLAR